MKNIISIFEGKNTEIPIWFMRQAGRYLPEYRQIRQTTNNFLELCYSTEKIVEITLQPIRRFQLDAAIIFSDILVLPHCLNWPVTFKKGEGPILKQFTNEADLAQMDQSFSKQINYVYQAISQVKAKLPKETALIGFAGSPWTVISYLLEGRGKQDFSTSKKFLYNQPILARKLFDLITEKTIEHLSNQIEAGAEVIQLFDSWAGMLNGDYYENFVIKPNQKIITSLKQKYVKIPVVAFPKNSGYNYDNFIDKVPADVIGVDQFVPVEQMRKWQERKQGQKIIQGNLDPVVLLSSKEKIKDSIDNILSKIDHQKFIFNLGHGVMPATDPANIEYVVNYVRNYQK